eukprot:4597364-Prymnesium_polylepis.1
MRTCTGQKDMRAKVQQRCGRQRMLATHRYKIVVEGGHVEAWRDVRDRLPKRRARGRERAVMTGEQGLARGAPRRGTRRSGGRRSRAGRRRTRGRRLPPAGTGPWQSLPARPEREPLPPPSAGSHAKRSA